MAETQEKTTFRLVFDGRLVAGRNATEVEDDFAKRFGVANARSVFSNSPVTLKSGLAREQAMQLQRQFEQLGMTVLLISSAPVTTELSIVEDPVVAPVEEKFQPQKPDAPKATAFGELPQRSQVSTTVPENKNIYTTSELDEAFKGKATCPPASRWYLLTLLLVAFLMLLLPLIYLGITAFSGYGVFWLATRGFSWFFSLGGLAYLQLIGFGASLLAAALLTLFLIRPLLATSERGPQPVRLEPNREPALFHLVERITEAIGAPMPHEILVDTEVNASARLTHGVFSRTLTLTIGLPLLYGLNVQTVTGILAHEFGHFTQHWGMRASYLVHQINYWFYRQVHERDNWDTFVDDLHEHDIAVLQLAAALAQLGSWICRLLLYVLGYFASIFSFSLSRQMEFDADRYEIALLGSTEYGETAKAIRILGAGYQIAVDDLSEALDSDRMADNLPRLAAIRAGSFSETDCHRIAASIEDVNTSVFDTHPTDQARIQKAIAVNMPPKFIHEGPAANLLCEIDRLSRLATLQWYRSHGVDVDPEGLVPLAEIESESNVFARARQARADFFGALDGLPEYLPLLSQKALAKFPDKKLHTGLTALTSKLHERAAEFVNMRQELNLQLEYQFYYGQALFWRRAGFDIDLNAYRLKLTTADPEIMQQELADRRHAEIRLKSDLKSCVEIQGQRLSLALEMAARRSSTCRQEVENLQRAYAGIAKTHSDDEQLQDSNVSLDLLLRVVSDLPNDAKFASKLKSEALKNEDLQYKLRRALAAIPDPQVNNAALADTLPQAYSGPRDFAAALADAVRIVRQLGRISIKVEGRMAEIALESGRALSLH